MIFLLNTKIKGISSNDMKWIQFAGGLLSDFDYECTGFNSMKILWEKVIAHSFRLTVLIDDHS